ncbi:MAG: ankyrin repeat domain-containing protein [Parachlamydia sp.]|nr:ankyrin repeat domain-containing protein [Parachlamydia sp.]
MSLTPVLPSSLIPPSTQGESPLIIAIGNAFKKDYPDLEEIKRLLALCQTSPEPLRTRIKQEIDRIEDEKRVTSPDNYRSILEQLISERHFDTSIFLIDLKVASISQPNRHYPYSATGITALHLAAKEGSLDVVQALVEAGVPVDPVAISISAKTAQIPDDPCYSTTPLSFWLEGMANSRDPQSYDPVLNCLLRHGADVNRAYLNRKPFISACIVKRQEDVALRIVNLVDLKAIDRTVSANVPRYHDQTPLYLAARQGMTRLVKALISREVDLNIHSSESPMSPSMYTALHVAVHQGNDEIVAALLQAGANANQKAINNAYGKELPFIQNLAPLTPWQWAVDMHYPGHDRKVIEAFKKYSTSTLSRDLPETPGQPQSASDIWYGKYSLPLRLITEEVRTLGSIPELTSPLRCYCPLAEKIPDIRACVERLRSRTSRLWTPIVNALESFSKREPELGIYFLPKKDINQSLRKLGACGTYNTETGHIITIDADWTFEHYDPTAVLIHEATHKMAHHIFESHGCAPIKGIEKHQKFNEALQKDLALFSKANWEGFPGQVKETLQEAVRGDTEKHPSEVIARLPEAAYLLSRFDFREEKIHQMLEKLFPNFFPLYVSEFIPACEQLAHKSLIEPKAVF